MAEIHKTTLAPTKLELLTTWLPTQPWYVGADRSPELIRAGGFRLDDPAGRVGIELMAVTDTAGDQPITYAVPLTYRDAPRAGADGALVGTTEHGVLGTRWVYDAVHDPVFVAQLLALVQGDAQAQAQSMSFTPDPTVASEYTGADHLRAGTYTVAGTGSEIRVGGASVHVARTLTPDLPHSAAAGTVIGQVTAAWSPTEGTTVRGPWVVVRAASAA